MHPKLNEENLAKVAAKLEKEAALPLAPLLIHGGLTAGAYFLPKLWQALRPATKAVRAFKRRKPAFKPIPQMSKVAPNVQLNASTPLSSKISGYRLPPYKAETKTLPLGGKDELEYLRKVCHELDSRLGL